MTDMIKVETNRIRFLLHLPNVLIWQTKKIKCHISIDFDAMARTIMKVLYLYG